MCVGGGGGGVHLDTGNTTPALAERLIRFFLTLPALPDIFTTIQQSQKAIEQTLRLAIGHTFSFSSCKERRLKDLYLEHSLMIIRGCGA